MIINCVGRRAECIDQQAIVSFFPNFIKTIPENRSTFTVI
jgi:hypothetical protein